MWNEYIRVKTLDEAINILSETGERGRIIAGATDIMLEMERGVRKGIEVLIDITSVPGLEQIRLGEDGWIHLGPLVTHNACVASRLLRDRAYPLVRATWDVGSPQIRNRGTVAGNIITSSPANDTIPPLMALGAVVTLKSVNGERQIPLSEFYTGVRKNVMNPDEILVDIAFPGLRTNQRGTFNKFALRRAQAISLVNVAVILTFQNDIENNPIPQKRIENAVITLGAVAPTIIHAEEAEQFLTGKHLNEETIEAAGLLAMKASRPINDVRGSAAYRKTIVKVMTRKALRLIKEEQELNDFPETPILLWGKNDGTVKSISNTNRISKDQPIRTKINGLDYEFTTGHGKSLLRLIREDALLIGSKEGCAEGECGACTVYLDGIAVMSCLVPAERADGAEITTVEGISTGDQLHPVQKGFVEAGAVQCGYCTPGLIMSAVKLLEERPAPSQDEIKQAITGNLCRCTGYYKIIEAIENTAKSQI